MKVRQRYSAKERQSLLAELQASELTISEFARQKQISRELLSQWRHRYVHQPLSVTMVNPDHSPSSPLPIPLQEVSLGELLGPASWAAEMVLPGGMVVRLDAAGQTHLLEHLFSTVPVC